MTNPMPRKPDHEPMWVEEGLPIDYGSERWRPETGLVIDGTGDALMDAVETVTDRCFTEAENLGWHKSWNRLIHAAIRGDIVRGDQRCEEDVLNWVSSKMLLVTGEICEAQEELRGGRDLKEIYYRDVDNYFGVKDAVFEEQKFMEVDGVKMPMFKPEGWLVEMADALIRICDLVGVVAGQEGVMFGPVVAEKLQYNTTRGIMHGGKKF